MWQLLKLIPPGQWDAIVAEDPATLWLELALPMDRSTTWILG
jgi:hypothetical protein